MKSISDFRKLATVGTTLCAFFPATGETVKRKIVSINRHNMRFTDDELYEFAPNAYIEYTDDCLIEYRDAAHKHPILVYTFAPRLPPCVRFKIQRLWHLADF